jgi:hypothetical protein
MRGGAPAVEEPACAWTNDPVQIEASLRVRPAIDLIASTSSGSIARLGKSSLPATMTVSADSIDAMASVTPNRVPIEVVTSRPSTDAIVSR